MQVCTYFTQMCYFHESVYAFRFTRSFPYLQVKVLKSTIAAPVSANNATNETEIVIGECTDAMQSGSWWDWEGTGTRLINDAYPGDCLTGSRMTERLWMEPCNDSLTE